MAGGGPASLGPKAQEDRTGTGFAKAWKSCLRLVLATVLIVGQGQVFSPPCPNTSALIIISYKGLALHNSP